MKITSLSFALILLISTFLTGCANTNQKKDEVSTNAITNTIKVYTTLYPLEDFAKKIGGAHVEVNSIIPPGVDTHTFEPSTKTMIEIAEADTFIFSSHIMEQYAAKIAESLKNEKVLIVEAAAGIEMIEHNHVSDDVDASKVATQVAVDHSHNETAHIDDEETHDTETTNTEDVHGHEHGDKDPHIWIDPILSIKLAENIKETLVKLKPEAKDEFEANFQTLKEQLNALDNEFHEMVAEKKDPKILVSHAAYGYWENNYGIKQIAVTGLSPTNEPSQKQLEEIIQSAKENNIKYVLFERNITPKIAKIVKSELKAEVLYLHNLEILTEEDIKNKDDYFSLMTKNIQTLEKAMN